MTESKKNDFPGQIVIKKPCRQAGKSGFSYGARDVGRVIKVGSGKNQVSKSVAELLLAKGAAKAA